MPCFDNEANQHCYKNCAHHDERPKLRICGSYDISDDTQNYGKWYGDECSPMLDRQSEMIHQPVRNIL